MAEVMDLFDTTESMSGMPRRTLTVFFIIDTSGSMFGEKIGQVNSAMEEVLQDLQDVDGADAEIKMAVLLFSDGCEWLTPQPIKLDANWTDIQAGGLTDFKAACEELNNKLSVSHGFMNSPSGCYAPVLILMTDGYPTDDTTNGDNGIKLLNTNNWYKAAVKAAIAIGSGANVELCSKFTGNSETVVTVYDVSQLRKVIKKIAVTSSQIASQGRSRTELDSKDSDPIAPTAAMKDLGKVMQGMMESGIDSSDDDYEW